MGARREGVKATDWIAILIALGAVVLSVISLRASSRAEERESAPLLVPGVEQKARGRQMDVYIGFRRFSKRADLLLLDSSPTRVVMPMRNAGEGGAVLLPPRALPVKDCDEAKQLPTPDKTRLHFYAVRPGESEQLFYNASGRPGLAKAYRRAADTQTEVKLLLRYTDTLSRKLRWTCVTYTRSGVKDQKWSVSEAEYGDREFE